MQSTLLKSKSHYSSALGILTCTGQSSLSSLSAPLASEFGNVEALKTIHNHPNLFTVTTVINVNCFESLLSSHCNRPFVLCVTRFVQELLALYQYLLWGMVAHMGPFPVHSKHQVMEHSCWRKLTQRWSLVALWPQSIARDVQSAHSCSAQAWQQECLSLSLAAGA